MLRFQYDFQFLEGIHSTKVAIPLLPPAWSSETLRRYNREQPKSPAIHCTQNMSVTIIKPLLMKTEATSVQRAVSGPTP